MIRFVGAFLLVLLAVLAPLVVTTVPPLHDYPFHLARADILASLPTSSFLRAHYEQGSFLLPNVGMDVVMLPLTRLFPILVAGRVFLGLTLISMLTGTIALHAALHRRLSAWPLVSAFFMYNWIFLYGFLNYLLGVGLMLWATAGWVMLRERGNGLCLAWATVMAITLVFCHLAAFGLFAIVIAGMELRRAVGAPRTNRWATLRGLALSGLPFAIALTVFIAISPAAGEAREAMTYHGGRGWKLLVAYRSLLTTIDWLDLLTLSPLLAVVVLLVLRHRLRLAFPMATPLCLLVLTFAVMPFYIFGSQFGDTRLPIAILLVAIASTSVVGLSRRTMWWIGSFSIALLLVRSVAITRDWIDSDVRIAAFTEAFRLVPDGATLYAATAGAYPSIDYRDAAGLALWHPPLKHVASLASLGRDVFVPSTWSDPFKQPMRVVASVAPVKNFHADNPLKTPSATELDAVVQQISELRAGLASQPGTPISPNDYLLLLYPDRFQGDLPSGSELIARSADFVLLRLS
jgi:hypothetical protein